MSTPILLQGDARALPLPDGSVDLIVTSPPYYQLRTYRGAGNAPIGAEATPREYIESLLAVTAECMRVLKPTGSLFVNLGDKYNSAASGQNGTGSTGIAGGRHDKMGRRGRAGYGIPQKSLYGFPWRYALRCVDDLGLILRSEIVWAKLNGLPESVTDRVRRSHEQLFHFTKAPHYYSATDEIREPHAEKSIYQQEVARRNPAGHKHNRAHAAANTSPQSSLARGLRELNTLGKLPGSVWTIPSQPLNVPDHVVHKRCCDGRKRPGCEDGLDHYAAFPFALVRPIILGWSPREVCTACGEGRRPVAATIGLDLTRPQARRAQEKAEAAGLTEAHFEALRSVGVSDTGRGKATQSGTGRNTDAVYELADEARTVLGGYAREYLLRRPTSFTTRCACPDTTAPTTPGTVLDPFGGTGSTALVAAMHGRTGISVDTSLDYCRDLATWRCGDPHERARAAGLEPERVAAIPKLAPEQATLFDSTGQGQP